MKTTDKKTENPLQDKISLELSKTYFGGDNDRRKDQDRRNDEDRRTDQNRRGDQRKINIRPIAFISLIVGIFIIYFLYSFLIKPTKIATSSTGKILGSENVAQPTTEQKKPLIMVPPITSETGIAPLFNFEDSEDGWNIPAWALNLRDHVGSSLDSSKKYANSGNHSLRVEAAFPEKKWSAVLVEIQQFLNLENFDAIAADIYFPPHRSKTLRGKIILTVGKNWEFVEMSRTFRIKPGTWTTVYANISENSIDWKRRKLDNDFKKDIRKMAIRVESTKTPYSGYVYIDNVRALSQEEFEKIRQ